MDSGHFPNVSALSGILGLVLVFVGDGAPRGGGGRGLIAIFRGFFARASEIFGLAGGLGIGLLSFYQV